MYHLPIIFLPLPHSSSFCSHPIPRLGRTIQLSSSFNYLLVWIGLMAGLDCLIILLVLIVLVALLVVQIVRGRMQAWMLPLNG